jgi:hypothetical protein
MQRKSKLLTIGILATCLLNARFISSPVEADEITDFQVASQWGEIRTTGVRTFPNGHRFLNASGALTGTPSDTYFRFDISALKSQLDNQFGSNRWSLTNVEIAFTQSNFAGSTAGGVRLYHIADDQLAITSGQAGDGPGDDFSGLSPSELVYGQWSTLPLGNGGNPILNYTFNPTATGDVDIYGVGSGLNINSISNWIAGNDFLTFALVADDLTVASYKGNEFAGRLPPQIRFTAIPEPGILFPLSLTCLSTYLRRRR